MFVKGKRFGKIMKFEDFNETSCLRLQGKEDIDSTLELESLSATISSHPALIVGFIISILLVIRSLYIWIVTYKLRYFLRISLFVFVCSYNIYGNPVINLVEWEEVPIFTIFSQKKIWSEISLYSGTICIVMMFIRYHWGLPYNIVKDNRSVGFDHLKILAKRRHCSVKQLTNKMLFNRNPGQLNPVYPNGWVPLIESSKVSTGQVVTVVAIGYKFCVFRGESGQVFVLDAYCPHLGADLSAGGQVIGNSIECPFHGWQFCGETGSCTKIPFVENIPKIARTKTWKHCEKNGYILIWYHAEGESPSWEIPSVEEVESGNYIYRGSSEVTVYCHIQDIHENGADFSHFGHIHAPSLFSGSSVYGSRRGLQHHWDLEWDRDETESHVGNTSMVHRLLFYGLEVKWGRILVSYKHIGPTIVYVKYDTIFGKGLILKYITSEGPMCQRVVDLIYTEPKFKHFPAICSIWGETAMFQRDMTIWNNKTYLKNPILVKEDKFISKFRHWYSQFYSENSPTLQEAQNKTLEW